MQSKRFGLGFIAVLLMVLVFAVMPVMALQESVLAPEPTYSLAEKVVGISVGVFSILQAVKKYLLPGLKGPVAVVLNVVLSIIGIVVVLPPEQLFTLQTAIAVLSAALGAAGIHGTWKNAVQKTG